jgi:hypothetical protein
VGPDGKYLDKKHTREYYQQALVSGAF